MPSEKSTYSKIFTLLQNAQSSRIKDIETLKEVSIELNQPIFFSRRYSEKKDDYVSQFSNNVLKRVISLTLELQLIDERGITELGKKALKRDNFQIILGKQIIEYLNVNGIKLKDLNKIISRILQEKIPIPPTANKIYVENGLDPKIISPLLFSKLLSLLSQCGFAKSSQTKIYLEFKSE